MAVSKKKTADAPAAAVPENAKNAEPQAAVSATSVKTETAKETTKKDTVEKSAAVKKEPAKKESAGKTTAKKAAAKKETAKSTPVKRGRTAKADLNKKVHIQFGGKSYSEDDLIKIAKDVWKYDLKQKANALESVDLYVKPEENIVYYVMNKEFTGHFMI